MASTAGNWELTTEPFQLIESLAGLRGLVALGASAEGEVDLARKALQILIDHENLERCSIFLLEDGVLWCAAGRGKQDLRAAGLIGEGHGARDSLRFQIGQGVVGIAASTGAVQHCRDCSADERFAPMGRPGASGSLICAPMTSRGRTIGVVNAYHPEPYRLQPWHEHSLGLFAAVLAHILDNNRALREHLDAAFA